uniref:Uncharacterized protein n=1 Tax=Oryza punctata TaxID=4537 RepID=A0A0E0L0U7_ORYPU
MASHRGLPAPTCSCLARSRCSSRQLPHRVHRSCALHSVWQRGHGLRLRLQLIICTTVVRPIYGESLFATLNSTTFVALNQPTAGGDDSIDDRQLC